VARARSSATSSSHTSQLVALSLSAHSADGLSACGRKKQGRGRKKQKERKALPACPHLPRSGFPFQGGVAQPHQPATPPFFIEKKSKKKRPYFFTLILFDPCSTGQFEGTLQERQRELVGYRPVKPHFFDPAAAGDIKPLGAL